MISCDDKWQTSLQNAGSGIIFLFQIIFTISIVIGLTVQSEVRQNEMNRALSHFCAHTG